MKTILAHGCFDILHWGHLKHLEAARAMGDYLIVSITADKYFPKHKGANRPVFNQDQRAEFLRALRCVDMVWICNSPSGVLAIECMLPAIYCKGPDYAERGIIPAEARACREFNVSVRYTDTPKYGSGQLVEYLK